MSLDINAIKDLLAHRYPFLLVDRVIETIPGQYIKSLKNVSANEPFFQGHFPDYPIMPGVLIIEALAQNAGIGHQTLGKQEGTTLLVSVKNAAFKKPVFPGDQLILESTIKTKKGNFFITENKASVDGKRVASCELWLAYSADSSEK